LKRRKEGRESRKKRTRRQGDKETRRQEFIFHIPYVIAGTERRVATEYVIWDMGYGIFPCLLVSLSPCLLVSLSSFPFSIPHLEYGSDI
jgi:hypothetical protein